MNLLSGCDALLSFQLDLDNQEFAPSDVTVRLSGPHGVIADWGALPVITNLDGSFTLLIEGALNVVKPGTREARVVDVEVNAGPEAGIQRLSQEYLITTQSDELAMMVNTFQNYAAAVGRASLIPATPGWDGATQDQRIVALISAFHDIAKMNYRLNLDCRDYAGYGLVPQFQGGLTLYAAEQFATFPELFREKLAMAQVAEADTRLTGDPMQALLDGNVLSERIGENVTTFRPGKPLVFPVARRTINFLAPFVRFTAKIERR